MTASRNHDGPSHRLANRARATLLVLMGGVGVLAGQPALAQADAGTKLTTWQQIVVVVIGKLDNAAGACALDKGDPAIKALLNSAGLDAVRDTTVLPKDLKKQIETDRARYAADRDAACASAWNTYGANGTPGVRDLLVRR